jgi:hypothetical protein
MALAGLITLALYVWTYFAISTVKQVQISRPPITITTLRTFDYKWRGIYAPLAWIEFLCRSNFAVGFRQR